MPLRVQKINNIINFLQFCTILPFRIWGDFLSFRLLGFSVIPPFFVLESPDEERHVADDARFSLCKLEQIVLVSKLKVNKEIFAFISLVTTLTN